MAKKAASTRGSKRGSRRNLAGARSDAVRADGQSAEPTELVDPALIAPLNPPEADRERQRREDEYDAEISNWKAGAAMATERITGKRRAGGRSRPGTLRPAMRILAEGDSWFDFPFGNGPLRNGDVIARLKRLIPYPILNMAVRGDEVRSMLGVKQRARLRSQLSDTSRDFNVLLFSGGGNDIVGDTFRLWLRDRVVSGADHTRALNDAVFGSMLQVVGAAYEDLIALRDQATRDTAGREITIFIHGYDWADPSGRGVCGFGPWLKPSLDDRGWSKQSDARAIVKESLSRFADLLQDIASRHSDVIVVPTQGTLAVDEWNDELHPNPAGFTKIARVFHRALKQRFPNAGL